MQCCNVSLYRSVLISCGVGKVYLINLSHKYLGMHHKYIIFIKRHTCHIFHSMFIKCRLSISHDTSHSQAINHQSRKSLFIFGACDGDWLAGLLADWLRAYISSSNCGP